MRAQHLCIAAMAALLAATSAQASVEISANPTKNMNCSGGVCSPTAKKAVLNTTDLAGMLASGDISVESDWLSRDIEIDAALSWASAHRLTLDAFRAITVNKPIEVTGTGALSIAVNDGGRDGDLLFLGRGHVMFWDAASDLNINGDSYVLVENIQQIADQFKSGAPFVALAKSFDVRRNNYKHAPVKEISGTFEGLGNRTANLKVDESGSSENAALFSRISSSGVVRDLNIDAAEMSGTGGDDQLVGAVAGNNDGAITNVHVTGMILLSADHSVAGGLVGESDGTILRCSANATVTSLGDSNEIGGLLGINYEEGESHSGSVLDSYSTGTVSAQKQDATNMNVGGLIGEAVGGNISNSYSRSETSESSTRSNAFLETGGLIGEAQDGVEFARALSNSYSTGLVNGAAGGWSGGFVGVDTGTTEIGNAYWDLDSSGISDPSKGAGTPANDPGVTGLTTAQLKSSLPSGFRMNLWRENPKINDGYPYLIANPPQ